MYRETEILKQPGTGTPDVFGDMVINVGPQHPATHGVLRIVLELDGEKISIAICADVNNPLHPQYARARQAGLYIAGIFFEPQSIDRLYRQLADYSAKFNMKILMANYGGPSYALDAAGRSAFWDDRGELVAQLETTGEEVLIVEI